MRTQAHSVSTQPSSSKDIQVNKYRRTIFDKVFFRNSSASGKQQLLQTSEIFTVVSLCKKSLSSLPNIHWAGDILVSRSALVCFSAGVEHVTAWSCPAIRSARCWPPIQCTTHWTAIGLTQLPHELNHSSWSPEHTQTAGVPVDHHPKAAAFELHIIYTYVLERIVRNQRLHWW